ncbi:hypothetical protein BUALT_Bualt13G0035100 [Buddleja alternifolia]|uniref:Uncharacterized protein n=1 Tax=Buddleja alternifolia TaxID=168488 RepID=A0AAV6WS59_9LAMI|nr:hypothetical protein BUALT_Bualt13G0035100 [Buddleja alternifolia]
MPLLFSLKSDERNTPKISMLKLYAHQRRNHLQNQSSPAISAIKECTTILAKGTSGSAKVDTVALPEVVGQDLETSGPATPLPATCVSLLNSTRSGGKGIAATSPPASSLPLHAAIYDLSLRHPWVENIGTFNGII